MTSQPRPSAPAIGAPDGRGESVDQRADRNWTDLLQELRVCQTGTQIIGGFLLTLPFQARFASLTHAQVRIYLSLVALTGTVVLALLLLAPRAVGGAKAVSGAGARR